MTFKKTAASVVLLLVAGSAMANWLPVKADSKVRVMADPASIRRSGDMVTMWSVINYTSPRKTEDDKPYLSSKQHLEYDCVERLSRRLEFSRHSDLTGLGQVVYANTNAGAWSPVAAGSVAGELFKFACGEK
jgi:hypothetical protein